MASRAGRMADEERLQSADVRMSEPEFKPMRLRLDNDWRFHLGDVLHKATGGPFDVKAGMAGGAASPDYNDADWRTVQLPHDWGIESAPTPEAIHSQGYYPRGVGWYRKALRLPPEYEGRKLVLEFEGMARNASVWVNGFFLGPHSSGYTPFLCDISDTVPRWLCQETAAPQPDDRPELIAVRLDASAPEGWWYEGCGLYRSVWLHVLDRLHIAIHGAWCETPEVSPGVATVRVHVPVENAHDDTRQMSVRCTIQDREGSVVAEVEEPLRPFAPGEGEFVVETLLNRPHLWSPDDPYLYRVRLVLAGEDGVTDDRELALGVRWFAFDSAQGFTLNGRPLKLRGVSCHQDYAAVGVALPDRLHEKRINLVKAMGANAFRCAHNPPGETFLDACDRLGLLVLNENRKLDISPEGLDDLRLMIRRDRHHPCIVAWSLFNEEFVTTRPLAGKAIRTAARVARQEDPSRPLTFAGNNFCRGPGTQDVCWQAVDLVGRNYGWDAYDGEHARRPEFRCLATEFSALRDHRGIYADTRKMDSIAVPLDRPFLAASAVGDAPRVVDAAGNTLAASFADLVAHWQAIVSRPYMAGGFLWTGMDYRGENSWPRIHSAFGAMDLCGFPKDSYYYFKAWWRPEEPLVHLFPHWTWKGREGQPLFLRAVGNCDEVELLVNGKSLGCQTMPRWGFLEWAVAYEPGEAVAIGYRGGAQVCRDVVRTAGAPARLRLESDRATLLADGRDCACVTATLLDANGTVVPDSDVLVNFAVEGAGRLLGCGNGDPLDHTLDASPIRKTFGGLCLAVLQGAPEPGNIRVSASAEGLPQESLSVKVAFP